jgi:hypothetical protein
VNVSLFDSFSDSTMYFVPSDLIVSVNTYNQSDLGDFTRNVFLKAGKAAAFFWDSEFTVNSGIVDEINIDFVGTGENINLLTLNIAYVGDAHQTAHIIDLPSDGSYIITGSAVHNRTNVYRGNWVLVNWVE